MLSRTIALTLTLTSFVAYADVTQTGRVLLQPIQGLNVGDLDDVTITTPSNDQILKYSGGVWVNGAAPAGASAINDLTDVTITSPSDTQVLTYSGGQWVNAAGGGGGANTQLNNLTSPVQVNQNLSPITTELYNIGISPKSWNQVWAKSFNSPSVDGATQLTITTSNITTGANKTSDIILKTGNQNDTGDSGDIIFNTGTVVGGTRGTVQSKADLIINTSVNPKLYFQDDGVENFHIQAGSSFFDVKTNALNIARIGASYLSTNGYFSSSTNGALISIGLADGASTSTIKTLAGGESALVRCSPNGAFPDRAFAFCTYNDASNETCDNIISSGITISISSGQIVGTNDVGGSGAMDVSCNSIQF